MKLIFKRLLQCYLKYITKFVLFIHHPIVIAVAGSANKTFIKEEIVRILLEKGIEAHSSPKSFNTEIGLPLAILNLSSGYHSYKEWLPIIFKAPFSILRRQFPRILVLEFGVSEPGDMKYLLSIVKPKISAITDITQRYIDAFGDMDELADEYELLVKKTTKLIVLNGDNPKIKKIAGPAKNEIRFIGFNENSSWQALEIIKMEDGQMIKIKHGSQIKEYYIKKFGSHHIYSLLAGLAIGEYVEKKKKI